MSVITNETIAQLYQDLLIDENHISNSLESLSKSENRFIKDLKLNVSSVLNSKTLSRKEAYLLALSVAVNEKNTVLTRAFEALAQREDASDAEIAETHACAGLMSANNVLYRFRHYMESNDFYNKQPAGIRMSTMMNPVLGKEFFELMSLVVSAVNGCEKCVTSHENSVKQHGADEARIFDAIRLAAVIRSLCVVI